MNISHDLYHKIFNPNATEKQVMKMTRVGIIITAGFALFLALFFDSIVQMWYTIGTIGISALIVPIMAGFFYKGEKSPLASILSMGSGSLTSLSWMIYGYLHLDVWGWPQYPFQVEPLYPGLLISLIVFALITMIDNKWRR